MPDFNDVVRHVILRIIVDSAGLAEELAKARTKLKDLESAERDTNKARAKDFEQVTKAVDKTTEAVTHGKDANDDLVKSSDRSAQHVADDWKAAAKEIDNVTKALSAAEGRRDAVGEQLPTTTSSTTQQPERARPAGSDAAREAREVKAAQREAERLADREAREVRAAHRDAQRLADKEAREAKAAQNEAARDAAKAVRKDKDAQRDADRVIAADARQRAAEAKKVQADQRVADRDAARGERERKAAEKDAAREVAAAERQRKANERDTFRRSRGLDENVQRSERDAYKESAQRNDRERLRREAADIRTVRTIERERERIEKERRKHPIEALFSDATKVVRVASFGGPEDTRFAKSVSAMHNVERQTHSARQAVAAFFHQFKTGEGEVVGVLRSVTTRIQALKREFRPSSSAGGGGDLFKNITTALGGAASSFGDFTKNAVGNLLSFKGMVIVAVSALGPLVAILGAVGAAALGLASNLGALSGVFFALPGLIGAAVGAFGLLALVMKPLSNVFTAYGAAQKAAAKGSAESSKAAVTAANALRDAQRRLDDSNLAHKRAVEDLPRAYDKLSDARKQARRDIEDYRLSLQKLRFDEEGAALDVESAQRAYKRSLVDPTSNSLDRRKARHAVEGALFDQRDQRVDAGRTQEDAAEAFRKGIEGADAVVAALRGVVDAQRLITDTLIDQRRAQDDLGEAGKNAAAGGSAARAAMDAYQAELAKLAPKTREVFLAVLALGDAFKEVQKRLSDRIFGQITGDTGKFATVLEELESFLGPIADALGGVLHNAILLFTNPDWKRFFSEQGKESGTIITKLGGALLALADGFKAITEVARPFTQFIVDGIVGIADSFKRFTESDKGRKSIGDFLELTQRRVKELWPIIKNFAIGFAGFFAALNSPGPNGEKDFTTQINEGLTTASEIFRKLGEAARDPNSGFQKWLRDVLPLVKDVGHFLGAVAKFFGRLFSDPENLKEAHDLLKSVSDVWLPKLADIFQQLSKSGVISKLAESIGLIFGGIDTFLKHGGTTALSVFADIVLKIVGFFTWMLDNVPGLADHLGTISQVLAIIFGTALAAQAVVLISKFTGLTGVIKGLKTLLQGDFTSGLKGLAGIKGPNLNTPGGASASAVGSPVMLSLRRIEVYLRQIAINTGGLGAATDLTGGPDDDPDKKKTGRHRAPEPATRGGGIKNVVRSFVPEALASLLGLASTSGTKPAATATAKTAATAVTGEAAAIGPKAGLLLRGGAKGGLVAILATIAASLGGDYLADKFVKNDDDKSSVKNAVGDVAAGGGLGSIFGLPGAGIGAAAGLIKNYATDKNFRDFFVDKLPVPGVTKGLMSGRFSEAIGEKVGIKPGTKPGEIISDAVGGVGDLGKSILDSLKRAGGGIADFFTKTLPKHFNSMAKHITAFFTKTLPGLPKKAFEAIWFNLGRLFVIFTEDLPRAVGKFFTKTIPHAASTAWKFIVRDLWDPFVAFIEGIPAFFTETIPRWFDSAWTWFEDKVRKPIWDFITVGIPRFFTETIPHWFEMAPQWIDEHIAKPLTTFFTETLPNFITVDLPNAFKAIPGWIYDHIVTPVVTFFTGLWAKIKEGVGGVWDWAVGLFSSAGDAFEAGKQAQREGKMSGGLIAGVYQGIEDKARILATPGEFMVRRSKVQEPGAKQFLTDFNEGRIDLSRLYSGLSASTAPQVMSITAPTAAAFAGAVPTVVNNTVNHAPLLGDVTIHNPVREKSEYSLRRQLQIAANRHRH